MASQLTIPQVETVGQTPVRCQHCGRVQFLAQEQFARLDWWRTPCGRCNRQMLRHLTRAEDAAWLRGMNDGGATLAAKAAQCLTLE